MKDRRYNFQQCRVLLVDDNEYMRRVVAGMLNDFGFSYPTSVGSGEAALEEMKNQRFDIAIVDWLMEPMDGLEFVRIVRSAAESANPFLPIILLTGYTEPRIVMAARDAGVTEVLAKPISARTLFNRLISIVETPRPFVRAGTYFGPDRRRHISDLYKGEERRKTAPVTEMPEDGGLSTADVRPTLKGGKANAKGADMAQAASPEQAA